MTVAGPEPLETLDTRRTPIDYEHYLAKQLEPVADGILPFAGDSFARLTSRQRALF
jgi:DNA polymerase-2